MPVMTILAAIWAYPEPTILFLFHSIQKVFANLYKYYKQSTDNEVRSQMINLIEENSKRKGSVKNGW